MTETRYGAIASVYAGREAGTTVIEGRTVNTLQDWIVSFDLPDVTRRKSLPFVLDDGYTAEVTRCCTDGVRNGPSMLYRAAWRTVRALGYRRLVTYTLPEEGGSSLRASGWRCIGEAGGGSWSRDSRPRVDTHPTQQKLRWEITP